MGVVVSAKRTILDRGGQKSQVFARISLMDDPFEDFECSGVTIILLTYPAKVADNSINQPETLFKKGSFVSLRAINSSLPLYTKGEILVYCCVTISNILGFLQVFNLYYLNYSSNFGIVVCHVL